MKYLTTLFLSFCLFFVTELYSCPYSAMTKIDEKLENTSNISKEKLVKVIELRKKGEDALRLGNVDKSEEILNSALALLK